MVTTGAEMPILNGISSAAAAGDAAPSASARQATVLRDMPIRMAFSSLKAGARLDRAVRPNGLGIGIAAVNRAAVAIRPHVLLDQAPDAILDRMETRLAFQRQPARPLDRHRDDFLDASRPAGEHRDTVGQVDRFVDLMGHEQHGLLGLHPDPQQLLLHRSRVCASSEANGSSISRIFGSMTSARARLTRCCMPPESS